MYRFFPQNASLSQLSLSENFIASHSWFPLAWMEFFLYTLSGGRWFLTWLIYRYKMSLLLNGMLIRSHVFICLWKDLYDFWVEETGLISLYYYQLSHGQEEFNFMKFLTIHYCCLYHRCLVCSRNLAKAVPFVSSSRKRNSSLVAVTFSSRANRCLSYWYWYFYPYKLFIVSGVVDLDGIQTQ